MSNTLRCPVPICHCTDVKQATLRFDDGTQRRVNVCMWCGMTWRVRDGQKDGAK
jgi:hypothetical protein